MSRFSQSKESIAKNIINTLSIRPKSANADMDDKKFGNMFYNS